MSKKDYQMVAVALHRAYFPMGLRSYRADLYNAIVKELADTFSADNSRFDRGRFIEACETGTCRGIRAV